MTVKTQAPAVGVTLATFDTSGGRDTMRVIRRSPLGEFTGVTREDYAPHGGTPLHDATALFIGELGEQRTADGVTIGLLLDESGSMQGNRDAVIAGANEFVNGMAEVSEVNADTAGTVFAVIFTDGYENQSVQHDHKSIGKLIADREADGWTFIYMGANQDAWAESAKQGYSGRATGQSVNFVASEKGTTSALRSATSHASEYLAGSEAYAHAHSVDSQRSVAEDGSESIAGQAAVYSKAAAKFADARDAMAKVAKTFGEDKRK